MEQTRPPKFVAVLGIATGAPGGLLSFTVCATRNGYAIPSAQSRRTARAIRKSRSHSCIYPAYSTFQIADIAAGLAYLHDQGVIHGDVKAANVLIRSITSKDDDVLAQLCDFGLTKMLHAAQTRSMNNAGTACHLSPERLRDTLTMSRTQESDVYAFAITISEASRKPVVFGVWLTFGSRYLAARSHSGA